MGNGADRANKSNRADKTSPRAGEGNIIPTPFGSGSNSAVRIRRYHQLNHLDVCSSSAAHRVSALWLTPDRVGGGAVRGKRRVSAAAIITGSKEVINQTSSAAALTRRITHSIHTPDAVGGYSERTRFARSKLTEISPGGDFLLQYVNVRC